MFIWFFVGIVHLIGVVLKLCYHILKGASIQKLSTPQKPLVEKWEFGYNEQTVRNLSNVFFQVLV